MRHTIFPLLFFLMLFLAGCHSSEVSEAEPLRHATLLRMELADSFTRVEVRDAWHEGAPCKRMCSSPARNACQAICRKAFWCAHR